MLSKSLVTAAALCALCFAPAAAAVPPPLPAPVATFDVGSLHVQQYGSGTQSLVFIPGLTCGPWEWSGQIAHFASSYTVYALTLPGFDGRPSIAGPLFTTVSADFWTLLATHHIVKPVVVGHSLGGTLAFMLATQHPERIAGVVSLDGLPVFPSSVFMTPEQIKAQAASIIARVGSATAAQFEESERTQVLPFLVTSPADVAAITPLVAKSSPQATAHWYAEDIELDLRPELSKATVPIELLAPYEASADGQVGLATSDAKRAFYAGIVKNAPNAHVVMIDNSRHFAMYDQPQAVTSDIEQFLTSLSPP